MANCVKCWFSLNLQLFSVVFKSAPVKYIATYCPWDSHQIHSSCTSTSLWWQNNPSLWLSWTASIPMWVTILWHAACAPSDAKLLEGGVYNCYALWKCYICSDGRQFPTLSSCAHTLANKRASQPAPLGALVIRCVVFHLQLTCPKSSYMPSKVWGEITYPFPNLNGSTVEFWEWVGNFTPHCIMDVIIVAILGLKIIHVSKWAPGILRVTSSYTCGVIWLSLLAGLMSNKRACYLRSISITLYKPVNK